MKRIGIFLAAATLCGAVTVAKAQFQAPPTNGGAATAQPGAPAAPAGRGGRGGRGGAAPQAAATPAAPIGPVGPKDPGPGVFTAKKTGTRLHLAVTGHSFTTQKDLENYLAYRAATETMANKMMWFSLIEHRTKADKAPPTPKGDPNGPRYSFRMEYFHPMWRYKVQGSPAWKSWSPYSGQPFFAAGIDPKTITDYELSADVTLHPGMVDDINPLAFDASAVSDFLINQVDAPK